MARNCNCYRGGGPIRFLKKLGRGYVPRREPEKYRVDDFISSPKLLVIDDVGVTLGVLALPDAMRIAAERGYNLVEVAPGNDPPVAKIMDYGRFKFAQAKKEKETRKRQKATTLKEVKLRPKIGDHDYEFKKRHAINFLTSGHKVKITIMYRGREMAHTESGYALIKKLILELDEYARPDEDPRMEGRNLHATMTPRPGKIVKKSEAEEAAMDEANEMLLDGTDNVDDDDDVADEKAQPETSA